MPATILSVSLLTMTPDAEALIYAACKQCTGANIADDVFYEAKEYVWDKENYEIGSDDERAGFHYVDGMDKLIRRVLDSGHDSVVEHVSFSFAISGVSRALSHQLVRHRIGVSVSQQSQRYVKADGFDYILPKSVEESGMGADYIIHMKKVDQLYARLVDAGLPAEDARFVLPNACATKLVVTMNCRALLHFFDERCCNRAQWEIRALAKAMMGICKDKLPVVFASAGPKCKRLGRCPEAHPCRQHVEQMAKEGGVA